MITCYIGLGGNIANALGTPKQHIANAIVAFYASPHFANVTASSLYQSKAFGVTDQPDFFNAVVKVDTDLAPLALSLIHISEPTRPVCSSRMPSSA